MEKNWDACKITMLSLSGDVEQIFKTYHTTMKRHDTEAGSVITGTLGHFSGYEITLNALYPRKGNKKIRLIAWNNDINTCSIRELNELESGVYEN